MRIRQKATSHVGQVSQNVKTIEKNEPFLNHQIILLQIQQFQLILFVYLLTL